MAPACHTNVTTSPTIIMLRTSSPPRSQTPHEIDRNSLSVCNGIRRPLLHASFSSAGPRPAAAAAAGCPGVARADDGAARAARDAAAARRLARRSLLPPRRERQFPPLPARSSPGRRVQLLRPGCFRFEAEGDDLL